MEILTNLPFLKFDWSLTRNPLSPRAERGGVQNYVMSKSSKSVGIEMAWQL